MDKVKAIKVLKPLVDSYVDYANITMKEEDDDIVDALEMAIEALKALDVPDMNVGDMISRQMAIDAIMGQPPEPHYPSWYAAQIEKLPAAQPATNCSEIPNSSDDTISRQAAIDVALEDVSDKRTHEFNAGAIRAVNRIKSLPSAQPEQVCVANVTLTDEQVKEVVEKAKNAVISVIELEPHWIPCSERLPETYGAYLVQDVCGGIFVDYWRGYWLAKTIMVAWRELPEPYKG